MGPSRESNERRGVRLLRMRPLALALTTALTASGAYAAGSPVAPAVRVADPISERLRVLVEDLERDARSPRAFASLVGLAALEDELPELARVGLVYARIADDPAAHPEVRAYARYRLADLERSRGNLQKAQGELAKLAFLDAWWIAGPFDDEGKRGFDEVFPPERNQDLAARFPGKAREVGWRPLPPEATTMGFAHVGAAVRPAREVVVYALAVAPVERTSSMRTTSRPATWRASARKAPATFALRCARVRPTCGGVLRTRKRAVGASSPARCADRANARARSAA